MDHNITMEITNDKLEEAIKSYATDRSKENLTNILNMLRVTKLFVPAMLAAPDKPTPCFLRNKEGEQYLVVYTSKEQIPEEPKSQAILTMTFPACNSIVVKPELKTNGMVINPFSDNFVLKKELIEKLHEVDEKAAHAPKQVKLTPAQFNIFVKKQVEFGILPQRLYKEKEAFVNRLSEEREAFIQEIFAEVYKEPKLNPYTEDDYSVMALSIAEDMTLIRVDFPEKDMIPPMCYRAYITFNPLTGKAGYYTIEMTTEKNARALGGFGEDGKHIAYGEAPVEGAEISYIMDLARADETPEFTS